MEPKKIVIASANVYNQVEYLPLLNQERRAIIDTLRFLEDRYIVHIEKETNLTYGELFNLFNGRHKEKKPKLLHYCGHSSKWALELEQVSGDNKSLLKDEFRTFLSHQTGLEVIFLNSCSSEAIGEDILLVGSIKAVIQTTRKIGDGEGVTFAKKFYQGLRSGKSLLVAFNQAKSSFEAEPEAYPKTRDLRSLGLDNDAIDDSICPWVLNCKEESFVANWYLIENRLRNWDQYTIKVLCLFDKEKEAGKFYPALLDLFDKGSFDKALLYSNAEIELQEDSEVFVKEPDYIFVLIQNQFRSYLPIIRPDLDKNSNAIVVPIWFESDRDEALQELNKISNTIDESIVRKLPFSLSSLAGVPHEGLIQNLLSDPIKEAIGLDIAGTLIQELPNLNFKKQREIFEASTPDCEHVFSFSNFNLLFLEGGEHCGLELLVKRLLYYSDKPIILKDHPYLLIDLGKRNNKPLSIDLIYSKLFKQIQDVDDPSKESIFQAISDRLYTQHQIIIMNDLNLSVEECQPVFEQFWDDLKQFFSTGTPKHKLIIFVLYKRPLNTNHSWAGAKFKNENPLFQSYCFSPVDLLKSVDLKNWHSSAYPKCQNNKQFYHLLDHSDKILREPYMAKAIAEICNIAGCPDETSGIILNF